jgi:GntR family transcriptional regulator
MSSDRAAVRAKEHLVGLLSKLPQGERLPGERILADDFGVCRVTLRRAIEDLISDGKLERRARSGTYVRRPIISSEMRLKSFSEEIRARGQNPSTRVISLKRVKANKTIAKTLKIRAGDEIFLVVRLRLADGVPIALETLRIACRSIPILKPEDVETSLYDAFVEKFGIRIMNAKAAIAGFNPSEKERSLLEIASQVPCLMIKMLDHDQNGVPIMTAECIYRSDLYELKIDVNATLTTSTNKRVS